MSKASRLFVSNNVCVVECAMWDKVCNLGWKLEVSRSDLVAVKGRGIWEGFCVCGC